MKKIFLSAALVAISVAGLSAAPFATQAKNLRSSLSGRILIAVQANGEAWYVDPSNQQRYFLGLPTDAFKLMQQLGLGISNRNFNSFKGKAPIRLSGRILLKVEDAGKAYYVNPLDHKLYYLGNPTDAFHVMRQLGLGITNSDLSSIPTYSEGNIPSIEVDNQSTKSGNVVIREVVSRVKGWIVIHKVVNGLPGDIVGRTAINLGENRNVLVDLSGVSSNQDLIAMLHYDRGQIGVFEFPGVDMPIELNGQIVMKKFFTTYAEGENKSVQIINFGFSPVNQTVSRGDTVTWTNNDTVAHTITSSGNFNSGNIAPGDSYGHLFNETGTYHYSCTIHPSMKGAIIVE
jgi:plastocyanin